MGQLQISTRKTSGAVSRVVYLVFRNVSGTVFPKSQFYLRVKEGNKVLHQSDYHNAGPLKPGEEEEHPVQNMLGKGLFKHQEITVIIAGDIFNFSVDAFG